jgi:hypothetical protein
MVHPSLGCTGVLVLFLKDLLLFPGPARRDARALSRVRHSNAWLW